MALLLVVHLLAGCSLQLSGSVAPEVLYPDYVYLSPGPPPFASVNSTASNVRRIWAAASNRRRGSAGALLRTRAKASAPCGGARPLLVPRQERLLGQPDLSDKRHLQCRLGWPGERQAGAGCRQLVDAEILRRRKRLRQRLELKVGLPHAPAQEVNIRCGRSEALGCAVCKCAVVTTH